MCSTNITTELTEVIENPLLYIEQPHLCILDSQHKFHDEDKNICIKLAANISDEDLRINKGNAICFTHVANVTEVHHNAELIELINGVNDVDTEMKEAAICKVVPKETLTSIPQNSSFMFHKDFYPKPRNMFLDAELSNESSQKLHDLLEEFSDIMSKNSKNIGLTHWKKWCYPLN